MVKKFILRLLSARHPWRYVGFDELSELYTSTMLRSMGLSVIGVFVPIYLYKLGYDVPTICLFMGGVYVSRCLFDVVAGYLTARIGPKHTMLLSNVTQIIALGLFLTLSQYQTPLWIIAAIWGMSLSMYFISYHVDFSKIMHQDHGGKELGFMTTIERVGAALGPLIGGGIATLIGAEYTILIAMALLMAATAPLFLTAEPTATHQKIRYRGLPFRKLARDGLSFMGSGIDNSLSASLWPLFLAVTILTANTYASVGLVTSLGIVSAILAATFIGKVIDQNKGRALFTWATWGNSLLHLVRPLLGSFGGVLVTNVVNEVLTTAYRMPYFKAMYARSDDLPGFRIAYIVVMEVLGDLGKVAVWAGLWLLCLVMEPGPAMMTTYVVFGLGTLLMLTQNFPVLSRRRLHL